LSTKASVLPPCLARRQTRPSTGEGSPGLDGSRVGQKIPKERSVRGIHQGRSSAMPAHERDQPRERAQVQHHGRAVQNDGEH